MNKRSHTFTNPKYVFLWFLSLLVLSGCGSLESIPYSPERTPETWLRIQPFADVRIGAWDITLVQPSSTVWVYLLGIVAIAAGLFFLRIQNAQRSRMWWGIALALWGAGALSAGTSYQAFSYEIKCAGQVLCSWTSWWEVAYLMLSAASVDAMMLAEAYACSRGPLRKTMWTYALANGIVYVIIVLVGAIALIKFLISFELLLLVTAPSVLFFFGLNVWRYVKFRARMDLVLLGAWLWLGITIGVYWLYLALDITPELWARGVWFSENDVLHIGLIIWMLYLALIVARHVKDVPNDH